MLAVFVSFFSSRVTYFHFILFLCCFQNAILSHPRNGRNGPLTATTPARYGCAGAYQYEWLMMHCAASCRRLRRWWLFIFFFVNIIYRSDKRGMCCKQKRSEILNNARKGDERGRLLRRAKRKLRECFLYAVITLTAR